MPPEAASLMMQAAASKQPAVPTISAPQPSNSQNAENADIKAELAAAVDLPSFEHEIGQRLHCAWRQNETRECEVVERRALANGAHKYYVHYTNFNRRLDEWVAAERLSELQPQAPIVRRGASAEKRRKLDPVLDPAFGERPPPIAEVEEVAGELDAATRREHEAATRVKNVNKVVLGKWEIETWYYSPFPPEYLNCDTLYFCEFDMHFVKSREALQRYMKRSDAVHPPGDEIFRNGSLSVFEVDGNRSLTYCQNLCLLAKLFLDHKNLYYDVEPFLFYVLTECDEHGCHPVAFFSKEKVSVMDYNLACILTLPPYQRKGYGRFLIALSYELSRLEGAHATKHEKIIRLVAVAPGGKAGTPERPLSDMGLVGYRSYWAHVLLRILQTHRGAISIEQLSQLSAIRIDDVMATLQILARLRPRLHLLSSLLPDLQPCPEAQPRWILQALHLIKYWKGQHMLCISPKVLRDYVCFEQGPNCSEASFDPTRLQWTPYHDRPPLERCLN